MCVQLPGVPRLVSSSYSAVRMSWMRNDMALSSSRHSWYSAGSESTVLTMFAPEERVRAGVREGAQRRREHGLDAVCAVLGRVGVQVADDDVELRHDRLCAPGVCVCVCVCVCVRACVRARRGLEGLRA